MTIGFGLVLVGLLLIYAGIKGKSVRALLMGDASTASKRPEKGAR